MDKKDLDQIKSIFNESFTNVWEGNIEPAIESLQSQIGQLPTKAYLDKKLEALLR